MTIDAYTPVSRQPRGIVKVNDTRIEGWIDVEVVNNNYYSADTFSVKFASSLLPAELNASWFAKQTDMYVEIFIGFPDDADDYTPADLKSWIYGQVDMITIDPFAQLIDVSGRDLTRVFIDTKTTQKWPNRTSSQIVTELATGAGLTPVVTATTTKAGKYYEIDHVNMTDERSEWDILCYLAEQEGFQVYVRGKSLYFSPKPDDSTSPYTITCNTDDEAYPISNVERLSFARALTVSRGIQVVIRSWHGKYGKAFTATYPSRSSSIQAGKATLFGGTQVYKRTIPNLTQEMANQKAKALYDQIIQHEMKAEFEMPGDDDLDTTSVIKFVGTDTAFDQTFYPDSITRTLNLDSGYSMHCTAKNHATESDSTV